MARILIGNIKGPKGDTGPQGLQGNVGPVGPQGPLPPLVNNGTTTETGFALDARYGKTLKDQLDTQNSNLTTVSNNLTQMIIGNKKIIYSGYQTATTDEYGNCTIPFGYTFSDIGTCVIASVAYSYEQCSASVRGVTNTHFSLSINVAGNHWISKEVALIWFAIGSK